MRRAICTAVAAFVLAGLPVAAFAAHAIKTRVSISVAGDKSSIGGNVKSPDTQCSDGRTVNVYSKHHGRFHRDAQVTADAGGAWASATNVATGTVVYKARVPRATVTDGACKSAMSRAVPVHFGR
jgi:hypothetical protein